MWFIGVEVEQETSAPPPKKNPGSAPVADCAKSFPSIESLKQTLLTGSLMGVGSDYLQNVSIVLITRYQ